MAARRFRKAQLDRLSEVRLIRLRSGGEHRPTGVWVVVVEGRVFVRSWNDKPTGWFRAFREEPAGVMVVQGEEIAVRGVVPRSDRVRAAVTAAYRAKYRTASDRMFTRGFATARRLAATLELQPA